MNYKKLEAELQRHEFHKKIRYMNYDAGSSQYNNTSIVSGDLKFQHRKHPRRYLATATK